MKRVAVFDTNVLISGKGWRGKPFQCLELARNGIVDAYTCREILDEFRDVANRKLAYSDDEALEAVADFLTFLHLVSIPNTLRFVKDDADDDKVLECAAIAHATHIVTGDTRHLLSLKSYEGIAIVTPSEFLSIVVSE